MTNGKLTKCDYFFRRHAGAPTLKLSHYPEGVLQFKCRVKAANIRRQESRVIPVRYNLRSLLERRATSLMTVLGLGMVAMIFVILFGFIGGLKRTMLNAGSARNFVLLSRGAPDETASFISHDLIDIVRVRPEISADQKGQPLLSPEIFAGVNISRDKHVRQFVL